MVHMYDFNIKPNEIQEGVKTSMGVSIAPIGKVC